MKTILCSSLQSYNIVPFSRAKVTMVLAGFVMASELLLCIRNCDLLNASSTIVMRSRGEGGVSMCIRWMERCSSLFRSDPRINSASSVGVVVTDLRRDKWPFQENLAGLLACKRRVFKKNSRTGQPLRAKPHRTAFHSPECHKHFVSSEGPPLKAIDRYRLR